MPRLRSTLNPEEQPDFIQGPTGYKRSPNQSELVCGYCHGINYVDEVTFQRAISAMAEGIDNPFCCDECEAEREELSH